jgi:hypothetical protein
MQPRVGPPCLWGRSHPGNTPKETNTTLKAVAQFGPVFGWGWNMFGQVTADAKDTSIADIRSFAFTRDTR